MNKRTHMIVGGMSSLGTYLLIKHALNEEPTLLGALFSAAGGALVANLPDHLEPAVSGTHRGFFHSSTLIVGSSYLLYRYFKDGRVESNGLKTILGVLLAGYGSHLTLDSFTPRSLPLITNRF